MTINQQAWTPDPVLTQEINDEFRQAIESYRANPKLITEHANHEEQIKVGGYANRALLELVQNAADAMAGVANETSDGTGRVEIVLDPSSHVLYCANSGRPFSKDGLVAISHAYLSAKRGDEIGRFGLGFKSVLAVTKSPQVFSRSVSFQFDSPEAQSAIAAVALDTKRFPVLRTPALLDAQQAFTTDPVLAEMSQWAATIVRLPNANRLDLLRREMKEFHSEFLLFVSAVREVTLRVLGDDGFETTHVSRDLGDGVLKIESPDGVGEEWIVENRMHEPSSEARKEVGEAVSRDRIKVTVAIPARFAAQRKGRFWSYFPLQDETSASGLFNAPWSVNDDRTTLLHNRYNEEILNTLAEMFVDVLPRVRTSDDPAAHLDYLPARGREETSSFGAMSLATNIPLLASSRELIPDATGTLTLAGALRPLDFSAPVQVPEEVFKAWIFSPNTANDVPHWRCYSSQQRSTRVRQLCAIAATPDLLEEEGRDMKRALAAIPKRGLLSWLREWADGSDPVSASNALKFVYRNRTVEGIDQAKVILTSQGIKSLSDRSTVFLRQEEVQIEGAVFVDPDFLAQHGVEDILLKCGFRNLDPVAILEARLDQLTPDSGEDDLTRFWESTMDVAAHDTIGVLNRHRYAAVKVPTIDGGWTWPQQAVDIDATLSDRYSSIKLDRTRCLPEVAHWLGVIRQPVKNYSIEDELLQADYELWVLTSLNHNLGPGERPIERISLCPSAGDTPGPFSLLMALRDSDVQFAFREEWTRQLLTFGDSAWVCEDIDSGTSRHVLSPVMWAVREAGIVNSTSGYKRPQEVVSPSLVEYRDLLPLYAGSSSVAKTLNLPDTLESVPAAIFEASLAHLAPPPTIGDATLVSFLLAASRIAYPGAHPARIPARVGRAIEMRPPRAVFLAINEDQRDFLRDHQRAYLMVDQTRADEFSDIVGCQRFEDSFAFSILIEGEQDSDPILDMFPGLRSTISSDLVLNATVTTAARLTKRVTTVDGVEDQSLPWHLDGLSLFVQSDLDANQVLRIINEAFGLHLSNHDLQTVLQAGLDQQLELLRQEALSAESDRDRLGIYFGKDDLREALPKGLWQALDGQGLIDENTSAADLYLTVYGVDSIKLLADPFRQAGFDDVPTTWAGGAATISWLRKMGFGAEFAGQRSERQDAEFVIPGAVSLNELHDFQKEISTDLRDVLTLRESDGHARKAMVELPTGAGKTRVATETVLQLFIEGRLSGTVLWIAQSQELCEQAVQTWSTVWRGLRDERPLTIGRLWEGNTVHRPDTEFSVVVATDAKLAAILDDPEYGWLWTPEAVIIDEGHVAGESTRYTRLLSRLGVDGRNWERPLIGLSATPFKGTSEEATKRLAARFGNRILRAFDIDPYGELAARHVLARIRHEVLPGVEVVLSKAERDDVVNRRLVSAQVMDRIGQDQARMAILVKHIQELVAKNPGWPILVFTPSVLSAQVLAATLRYRNISAASVSGQTGRQQRREVIRAFKEEEIQVLANCDLLAQGFDAPGVRALYIARPTFSPNAYIQMAGRGLRGSANGGKEECLIVDMADNFGDISDILGYREYEELWKEQS